MAVEKKEDVDKVEDKGPWRFQSLKRGYTCRDPRSKPPSHPELAKNWIPDLIEFKHHIYETDDPDLGPRLVAMVENIIAKGYQPDFFPIGHEFLTKGIKPEMKDEIMKHTPGALHGPVSVETAVPENDESPAYTFEKEEYAPAPRRGRPKKS